MNFKTTYILFGVMLLLALPLLGLALWYHGYSVEHNPERLFPSASSKSKERQIKPDDITRVVIHRNKPAGADIVFERKDKDKPWKLIEPRELRVDGSRVNSLVDSILNADVDQQNQPESLKKAGLDNPSRIISLHAEEKDRTLKLTLGDTTPGEESALVYVLSSEWPDKPLAVRKRTLEPALEGVAYFRSRDLLGEGTSSDIRGLTVSQAKKGTVELRKQDDRWRFIQPPYGDADIDSAFIGGIDNIKVEDTRDFIQDSVTDLARVDKDLPRYAELRITVERKPEDRPASTSTLVVLLPPEEKKKDREKKDSDKLYAYVEEAKGKGKDVVKVSRSHVQPLIDLLEHPEAKRNHNLVALEAFKTPDAIDVENSYGLLEFRKGEAGPMAFGKPDGGDWQLYRGGTAHATDAIEVRKLIDALTRTKATSFPDPKRRKELGLDKPDVTVRIWADSLEKPERKAKDRSKDREKSKAKPAFKKGAKPAAELRFGRREGESVAVERIWGKDSTLVLVPASVLDQVRQRPLAYYDKRVPGFATGLAADADVTRLELQRGGETIEVKRARSGAPWKFVLPKNLKDRDASESAISDILGDLNRLSVVEVVSEKPTADELAKTYGLTRPSYRAVVTTTKDGKDRTHIYEFGSEVKGKGYHARVSGSDTVYLVDGRVIDTLKRELRDTTVLKFDPSQVKTIELTGWSAIFVNPKTATLERKGSAWIGKGVADFPIDAGKVDGLLGSISNLQADRFVSSGKGLKPSEGGFQIKLTLDDRKVLELTVGAVEGDKVYATSSQVKGEVFLVNKEPFEKPRQGPAYFAMKK